MDFRNVNMVWASVVAETLHHLGLEMAVICPGSRSAPLAIAFAQHPAIHSIPVLDERSAAFFALGRARRTGKPVVLICSSGTAGANFYPAVIEAREGRVPLLVLTGDRPPELRDCNAGQTIDQQKLFGHYPNRFYDLAVPSVELSMLAYLRQTIQQAWEQTQYPVPGAVHLNCPFRDPLAPLPQVEAQQLAEHFNAEEFFAGLEPLTPSVFPAPVAPLKLPTTERGIIVAGPAQPLSPQHYGEAIAHLSKTLGFPVLAEGLSPLRNYADLNPYLISTYDLILRNSQEAEALAPEVVIRVGETPTSKVLRGWLQTVQPFQWMLDASDRNLDPLHLRTRHLRQSVEQIAAQLQQEPSPPSAYLQRWNEMELQMRQRLDTTLEGMDDWLEGKVAWLLSQSLPEKTPLFIANSMSVRYVEWFWQPGRSCIQPYFNRGANGIDGTLSTALGMVQGDRPGVLLTGDLALLHDTNGFLLGQKLNGHLTIVLINNHGGGIFETLPISHFNPPFEEYFATPQEIDFEQLANVYKVQYEKIHSWAHLKTCLRTLPLQGIRVLEVKCDRKRDAQWLRSHLNFIGDASLC
ncbi:2-succinyl-5-enolpyruvyl-6-hydroxy-3-cyclohexene-1-carboxylic-acid synthase [Leptolyngbya sp. FACHB-16]|uniref:2-succinyl-5-enolpyruvyl-6-hydroxy-3- cyclohexene-1-carboxylic-acid synthase n=1 Tax=unclassified Leptolyngbya TaxID=2650499 RepID=UPI001685161F|nr:2-succinyl-5-enolpyruvyl-6-hydroxy-3-cyclohexene-1-carboxylic-acid synthase [Leptolyngbya sp. FACHB-16]MBD2153674.1 2-succinyl-5-enolpyruvyl-6-hydroxy-3-cyclohexene-1-carboxylic-acid synthase [Leptolyngbya sp. FACHB-16]